MNSSRRLTWSDERCSHEILVTGGTGTVGSQVVRELLTRGAQVQVLTRDPAKAGKLPAGVTAVTGDLSKVETVKRVFKGVDGVFLVNTVSPTEVYEGLLSACALREEKVKRVVYLSVHHADGAPWLPHFGGKVGVEQAVLKAASFPGRSCARTTSIRTTTGSRTCCCSTACIRSRSATSGCTASTSATSRRRRRSR